MCVNYKLCVKLHKGPFAFNMEKFPSLENFYTHTVTGVTDNQVCQLDTPVQSNIIKVCLCKLTCSWCMAVQSAAAAG